MQRNPPRNLQRTPKGSAKGLGQEAKKNGANEFKEGFWQGAGGDKKI